MIGAPPCTLDLAGNAQIDAADLSKMLSAWGACDCREDYNGDGLVNSNDLALLLSIWGQSCP